MTLVVSAHRTASTHHTTQVRETGDHGPLNSWDRQPYWTLNGVDDGFHDPQVRVGTRFLCRV